MAVKVHKLKAFLNSPQRFSPVEVTGSTYGTDAELFDESEAEEMREALQDDMSEESQLARKLNYSNGYMEISEPQGYSCGNCKYFTEGDFCGQPMVLAYVDGEKGCCNLFSPAHATIVFPPPPETEKDEVEEHDEKEEPEDKSDGGEEEHDGDEGDDE